MEKKSILILGSQGFIGRNLVHHFIEKGYHVTGCDLVEFSTDQFSYHKLSVLAPDFDTFFQQHQFPVCINAAGSGNVLYSVQHPFNDFEANAIAVAKLLNDISRQGLSCKYIHISSAAVYGNPAVLPVQETEAIAPVSPYGYHKLVSETICREYHHLFQFPVLMVRPFSVYGKGLRKQLFWELCSKMQVSDTVTLFGSGNETRDFINVADFCEVMELLVEVGDFNCSVYNIANGIQTTIKEIADLFEKHFPGEKKIAFNGSVKQGDPLNWQADISKVKKLGYKQKVLLESGIKDYIDWFIKQQSLQ